MWSKPKCWNRTDWFYTCPTLSRPAATKWEAVNKRHWAAIENDLMAAQTFVIRKFWKFSIKSISLGQYWSNSANFQGLFNQGKYQGQQTGQQWEGDRKCKLRDLSSHSGNHGKPWGKIIQEVCINKICYLDLLRESEHHTTWKSISQGQRRLF